MTASMLFGYIYAAKEGEPTNFEPALRELTAAVGIEPRKMSVATPTGSSKGERKFSWEWFGDAAPGAEYINLWGGPVRKRSAVHEWRYGYRASSEELTVCFHPRYLTPDKRYQLPPRYYTVVPSSERAEVRAQRVALIETFLLAVVGSSTPLHGGIAATPDADRAFGEILMQSAYGFRSDPQAAARFDYDGRRWEEMQTVARRAYWATILGPDLAAATGGIEAARSTGAARVEMRTGCLVVQSTSDVNDYLSPDWPERALPIRRWLWPHSIQNPFDDPDKPRSDEVSR